LTNITLQRVFKMYATCKRMPWWRVIQSSAKRLTALWQNIASKSNYLNGTQKKLLSPDSLI